MRNILAPIRAKEISPYFFLDIMIGLRLFSSIDI